MKSFIVSIALVIIGFSSFAQTNRLQEVLAADTILSQVYHHLPAGWVMTIDDTSVCVTRTEKYALIETDCSNLSADSLQKIQKSETAVLRFLYEAKWSDEQIFWTRETNDSLNFMLGSLPQQMGVTQLLDTSKSTRFNRVYTGKTKAEKEKVSAYYKRKQELTRQIHGLPTFNTTKYSLRQRAQTGMQRPGTCIYPSEVYKEVLALYIVFMEYCENPLQ